jgi:ribosomal protein L37AE/L43A
MRMNTCHCCGSPLLRHARQNGVYWFCTSCRQEMLPVALDKTLSQAVLGERSLSLELVKP